MGKLAGFKKKIKSALAASFDAMIAQKIDVAVVTKLSAELDAPRRFRPHLQDHQFKYMVRDVLDENNRRSNFKSVIIAGVSEHADSGQNAKLAKHAKTL